MPKKTPTKPPTTKPVADQQPRRVTREYLESLGFEVPPASGKAYTFLGVEGMVAAQRRAAAKRKEDE
jgi:hypothetical protein